MILPTHFVFPAAMDFAARHRAPEAAKLLTPEARLRLVEADSVAWRLRLEAALRGVPPDAPITLPPDKVPPAHIVAAQQAFRDVVEAVTRDLRQALEAGALRAVGFPRAGAPVAIPPAYWRTPVRWCEAAGATIEADPFERAAWGGLVPMGSAFVEPGLDRGDVARRCGALPPERAATYSPAALRAWYRLRVGTSKPDAPPPTEADDTAAAAAVFGTIVAELPDLAAYSREREAAVEAARDILDGLPEDRAWWQRWPMPQEHPDFKTLFEEAERAIRARFAAA